VRAMLRGGLSDSALQGELRRAWQARTDRYSAERFTISARTDALPGAAAAKIEMSYIGG
jgi:hypothetical protein